MKAIENNIWPSLIYAMSLFSIAKLLLFSLLVIYYFAIKDSVRDAPPAETIKLTGSDQNNELKDLVLKGLNNAIHFIRAMCYTYHTHQYQNI